MIEIRKFWPAAFLVFGLALGACGDKKEENSSTSPAATPATAASVALSEEGADKLAGELDSYLKLMEATQTQGQLRHDKVEAIIADGAYRVTIRNLAYDETIFRAKFGDFGFDVKPQEGDLYAIANLTHAPRFTIEDASGKALGEFGLTTKQFSGLFSPAINDFLNLEWTTENASVKVLSPGDPQSNFDFTIAAITLKGKLSEAVAGRSDQTIDIELSDLKGEDRPGGDHFAIGKVVYQTGYEGVDLQLRAELQKKMQDDVAAVMQTPNASPAAMKGAVGKAMGNILEKLPQMMTGARSKVAVEDILVANAATGESIKLKHVGFDFSLTEIDREKAKAGLHIDYAGLDLAGVKDLKIGAETEATPVIPPEGALLLDFSEVPAKESASAFARFYQEIIADPTASNSNIDQAFGDLAAIIAKAPIKLKIAPSYLKAPILRLDLKGDLDLSAAAAMGAAGRIDIDLAGLDAFLDLAAKAGADPELQALSSSVLMLKSLAAPGETVDGTPADHFSIEIAPDGTPPTINGKPMPF